MYGPVMQYLKYAEAKYICWHECPLADGNQTPTFQGCLVSSLSIISSLLDHCPPFYCNHKTTVDLLSSPPFPVRYWENITACCINTQGQIQQCNISLAAPACFSGAELSYTECFLSSHAMGLNKTAPVDISSLLAWEFLFLDEK